MGNKTPNKILIIGASSGIGNEVAKIFISKGYIVGVAARRAERLAQLVKLAPSKVHAEIIDVTGEECEERLMKLIHKMGGTQNIFLVAGVGKQNQDLKPEIEENTIATNVVGFTRVVDTAFRYFRDNNIAGHIAVISSIAGTKGLGTAASYSATKRYQNTYIEALEQLSHLKKLNITFTDIRPGFVDTDLLDKSHHYPMMLSPQKAARKIVKAIIRKRHVATIDWKYSILVKLWKMIPRRLWRNLPIKN